MDATTVRSMTGFGAASEENGRYRVTARLRSVNHRNLDLSIRLPEGYRSAEASLRTLLKEHLSRGRIELRLDVECVLSPNTVVEVDRQFVSDVLAISVSLRKQESWLSKLGAGDLLRLPGALQVKRQPEDWLDSDEALLRSVVELALEQLIEARKTEGESLAKILSQGLQELRQWTDALSAAREGAIRELHNNLRGRLKQLLEGQPFDEQRLAQEAAYLVERSDVAEEIERLFAHLEHGLGILTASGPMGKRLDFLLQEIQRELNTLGAKCRDLRMNRIVLDGKVVCEQLREQVQNVE